MDRVVGCPVRSCEVRCGGVEVEAAVWRGVCRTRGVHERAYRLILAFEPIQWWAMLYGDSSHLNMGRV